MKSINIALAAHGSRKEELLTWVKFNASTLSKHNLYAIGTTGRLIGSHSRSYEVLSKSNGMLMVTMSGTTVKLN